VIRLQVKLKEKLTDGENHKKGRKEAHGDIMREKKKLILKI
jgi:hypothetical protein